MNYLGLLLGAEALDASPIYPRRSHLFGYPPRATAPLYNDKPKRNRPKHFLYFSRRVRSAHR